MKVSFDFDFTLTESKIKKLAIHFIKAGHDVWITTTRVDEVSESGERANKIVFDVAEEVGISKDKIRFTHKTWKWNFLHTFDLHFDDKVDEVKSISENCNSCVGVLIINSN